MCSPARLVLVAALASAICWSSDKPFVDSNRDELLKSAPELGALQFDSDQSKLDALLRSTGQQLETMLAKFINVSLAEEVHEMRFDSTNLTWTENREKFRYVIQTRPFAELRNPIKEGGPLDEGTKKGFLLAGRFVSMLSDLLPENQAQSQFRYLGRIPESGWQCAVITFLTRDGTRQGIVWVNEAQSRIVRLRTDFLHHAEGISFDSFTRDVRFTPVDFPALATTPWLPTSATVHATFAKGEVHTVDRFSDYHVDGYEDDTDAAQLKEDTGAPAQRTALADDGFEVILTGLAALQSGETVDAVSEFQEAAGRLPARLEPLYYLGTALYRLHDLAAAETQFREVVKRSPNLAAVHNQLATVLFERHDKPGAEAEFQEALRLAPGNETIRANLDASSSKPSDVPLKPSGGDVTIKVDVRQVLVPVVVTNKEGHHINGLTQADFRVFEDGVEQMITAFGSERADISAPANASAELSPSGATAQAGPKPLATRHAYVICVDTMHASFGNFVHVREALQKLFQQEQAGDSQYVVLGLGRSIEIVQNTTSDPAKVLQALASSTFRKTYLQSQKASSRFETDRYERELQEVRSLCDANPPDPQCPMRKRSLPSEASRLEEETRFDTNQFLAQLRSVVEQLARGSGRRTLILISDGFLLAPGKIPHGLLEAYFPEFRSTRSLERLQGATEPIFRLAVKANVPIYTIDSRGLYSPAEFDVSRGGVNASVAPQVSRTLNDIASDEGATLSEIAAATGGTSFHNSNDLLTGLKRAFADGRDYYVLAYVPANEAQDGKFRKIEVKVRDNKALVSAKRGYWANLQ